MDRHAKFLWMKDLLDHLQDCHEQWENTDPAAEGHWYAAMQRDMSELRRLCESLRNESVTRPNSNRMTVAA